MLDHLAHRIARHRIDEVEALGNLVAGQVVGAEPAQVVLDDLSGVLGELFITAGSHGYLSIPKQKIDKTEVKSGFFKKKVIVTVGGRKVTLPEHPLLWAAFFLSGEP